MTDTKQNVYGLHTTECPLVTKYSRTALQLRQTTGQSESETGELSRWRECSKLTMQSSGVDIHRAMHNGPVVVYAYNRIMHVCDMPAPGFVFH